MAVAEVEEEAVAAVAAAAATAATTISLSASRMMECVAKTMPCEMVRDLVCTLMYLSFEI